MRRLVHQDLHRPPSLVQSDVCDRLVVRRSLVRAPPGPATFFRGDCSYNIFYGHSLGHSLASAD